MKIIAHPAKHTSQLRMSQGCPYLVPYKKKVGSNSPLVYVQKKKIIIIISTVNIDKLLEDGRLMNLWNNRIDIKVLCDRNKSVCGHTFMVFVMKGFPRTRRRFRNSGLLIDPSDLKLTCVYICVCQLYHLLYTRRRCYSSGCLTLLY